MILKRMSASLRRQDWAMVFIKFLLVVVGVVLGFQIDDWANRRSDAKESREAMERLLDALTGKSSSEATRESFRQRYRDGSLDTVEVEIEVVDAPAMPFDVPGQGGIGMINLSDMMSKMTGGPP